MSTSFPMPAPTPVWHLYRTLVGVGVVCGLLIVAAYAGTKDRIRDNKIAARQAAVLKVLPGATSARTFRFDNGSYVPVSSASEGDGLAFAGFDAQNHLVGVAVEAHGNGYQDVVKVLYGYSFEQQAVIGINVLESHETPGLGDRAESDPDFLANFVKLDVALADDKKQLAHPVEFTKHGSKQHAWQIDGITGATVTSSAIGRMMTASTATVIPQLFARRADFQPEGK